MKLFHIALCACALSACALDDGDDQTTTVAERRIRLTGKITLAPNCQRVDLSASWIESQPNQAYVYYEILDTVTTDFLTFTIPVEPTATSANLVGEFLQPLQSGRHRISLTSELWDTSGAPLLQDGYRTQLPCYF
jgi:hypothetical protein